MIDLEKALRDAIAVAEAAGNLLKEAFERSKKTALTIRTKSNARDFVTEVDGALQRFIVDRLTALYPNHRFIAEEEGADALGDPKSPYAWIIDPLDGTTNFIHGKPSFATMIALMEAGEIVAGVINMPMHGELFSARKGGGAFLNGKPVQLRRTRDMNDAIITTNMTHQLRPCTNGELHVALPLCAAVQNYGCAAEEMGEILRGGNDGVYYTGVGLWDVAPGCLMISEAGGRARWEFVDASNPRKGVNCVAGTREIFPEIEKRIF